MFICSGYINNGITLEYWEENETFEEKLLRMKHDKFKKQYPVFKDMDKVIEICKTNTRIYNETVMKEVRFGADLF